MAHLVTTERASTVFT